ncbi:flagellar basal body-associated FliL family protein [Ostreiculturibacter nitratireducens]|uniref:flagellar basal body-associated FliL family protein n=1 Tax=Ostreiculturibacter nitratireducens TaxID=3075226 RepID=UPI0031B5D92E
MAAPDGTAGEASKKRSKLPLMLGLALMLALGAGSFFAVYSGILFGHAGDRADDHAPQVEALPDIAFVAVDPLVITLGAGNSTRHLRFSAQIEVPKQYQGDVALLLPRILDVLNGYLRAVDARLFDDPSALMRLRAQMLRRVQIVTGEGRVRDLLVTEFVLN